jgi:class 3 adenylate cyclase
LSGKNKERKPTEKGLESGPMSEATGAAPKRASESSASNSLVDMIMDGAPDDNSHSAVVDSATLIAQTQDRLWRALTRRFQYDSSLSQGQEYLLNHVSSRVRLVILYADLAGSTNMSMTLPAEKLSTIIQAFTYEMSSVVQSHKGYVLKYVGDAVIAFFPSSYNKILACDMAVQCANSMITVIKNGINPILNQYDYPELNVKVGIDEGENVVVQYGHDRSSLIDILGYCMNIASKITSLTKPNKISVGEDVYEMLHPSIKSKFKEMPLGKEEWRYTDRETGRLYRVYTLKEGKVYR